MRINPSTTIVDLAFNLSGSLAGIPAALSQLPVGEKIGFATLPKLWEDVSDIGQTWTPSLEGVEVDITLDVYNPTAVQKAPYTTDIGCIEHAANWGNALLEVLDSKDWFVITDVPTDVSFVERVRVINLNEPVTIKAQRSDSYSSFVSVEYTAITPPNLVQYIDFGGAPTVESTPQFNLSFGSDRIVAEVVRAKTNFSPDGSTAMLTPWYGYDSIWSTNPNLTDDWFDELVGVQVTRATRNDSGLNMWKPPFDTGWAFKRNIFVKLPSDVVWYENLEQGSLDLATGEPIDGDFLRSKFFSKAKSDSYLLKSSADVSGAILFYSSSFEFLDFWNISANDERIVTTPNAAYFKVLLYAQEYSGHVTLTPQ